MRVVVLGAGVIGVTTAWALSRAGHEVLVLERQQAPAQETSFANGGQLSVSHAEPWANPQAPWQILKWLGKEEAPLLWRMRADVAQWSWGCRFLVECLPHRTRRNTQSLLSLGLFSRRALAEIRDELDLNYHQMQRGILHFYTDHAAFEHAKRSAEFLSATGVERLIKSAEECLRIEPALADSRDPIVGGTFTVDDESGDARVFTEALARACAQRGVDFRFGATVSTLERHQERIIAAKMTDGECLVADAFVVALGCHSAPLLNSLGLKFPIYPLKGYSASIAIQADTMAPYVSLTDEAHKLVFSRLGDVLRVAGTAEFAGYDLRVNETRCAALMQRTREIFPSLDAVSQIEFWTGLRPATPGNVPFIGVTEIPNLWLNSGHGTLGWTLACGSAKLLAQMMSGMRPGIDQTPFRARYGD
ncbi:MAG: D-amino acid dehydrogenase [Rhodocyclaceae bacterium]|nr:D-amino acid dehydrogenase [Rhodocyclaceae bacterium]MBL0076056.1 D-amino acid dehydrogenase [Rhodocyclaceae bacterium]MBP6108365.1 D-amino acid dehydrogenase [Rhodocyclaceae bacterium]MBP6278381.1 D-amino acid dehydrogenase [Rhodocyclaceae bacterium]